MKDLLKTIIVTPLKWLWLNSKKQNDYHTNITIRPNLLSGLIAGIINGVFIIVLVLSDDPVFRTIALCALIGVILAILFEFVVWALQILHETISAINYGLKFGLFYTLINMWTIPSNIFSIGLEVVYFILLTLTATLVFILLNRNAKARYQ